MALDAANGAFSPRSVDVLEARWLLSATVWVDPASTKPADFHTIQSAVNAAVSGETIKVAPGTYHESVTVPSTLSNLTIVGGQIHLAGESGPSTVASDTAAFTLSAAASRSRASPSSRRPRGTTGPPRGS